VQAFAAMVRSPIPPTPLQRQLTDRHLPSSRSCPHTCLYKTSQSSPILGICFCLIIVRLGQVFPVAQEETWHPSIHTPSSRSRGSNRVSVSFPKVDIRQDVCEGDSKDFPMETLESQKQEYVGSSNEPPKVFRPSLSLSPHT